MKTCSLTIVLLMSYLITFAQAKDSPYELSWRKDTPWIVGSIGGTALGLYLKTGKKDLTLSELNGLQRDDVFIIDRWAVGNFSESASNISDIPFYGSFALPLAFVFDKSANKHSLQLLGLYLESLTTTAALYTVSSGLINRSRPLVFNEDVPINERLEANGQSSFFSGHVAATATATFFAAKVFSDFHPDSPLRPLFWTTAAILPAAVGYLRIESGKHYLTDVVLGYAIGASVGILVPELHKIDNSSVNLYPTGGRMPLGGQYTGIGLRYDLD